MYTQTRPSGDVPTEGAAKEMVAKGIAHGYLGRPRWVVRSCLGGGEIVSSIVRRADGGPTGRLIREYQIVDTGITIGDIDLPQIIDARADQYRAEAGARLRLRAAGGVRAVSR